MKVNVSSEIKRHAREFGAALRSNRYEVDEESKGIYIPSARIFIQGEYFFDTNGENPGVEPNLVPLQGMNYLLDTGLRNQAAIPNWYLAICGGAFTPTEAMTAADFAAATTEHTSNTNGFSETTRQAWVPAAAATGGVISSVSDDVDNKASFTITATGANLVIRGCGLLSQQAKGAVGGVLVSVSRFSADRVHYAGDTFNLGYRVRARQPT